MLQLLKKHKSLTVYFVLLVFITAVVEVYIFFASLFVFQAAFDKDIVLLIIWSSSVLAGIFITILMELYSGYINRILYNKIGYDLKILITNQCRNLSYQAIANQTYNLEALFLNDLKIVEEKGFSTLQQFLKMLFTSILIISIFFVFSYIIAVVGLAFFVIFAILPFFINKIIDKQTLIYNTKASDYVANSKKHLEGLETLFFANKISLLANLLLGKENKKIAAANVQYVRFIEIKTIVYGFCLLLAETILLYTTATLFDQSQLPFGNLPGIIFSIFTLANNFFRSAFGIFNNLGNIKAAQTILRKIKQLTANEMHNQLNHIPDAITHVTLTNFNYQLKKETPLLENCNYQFVQNHKYLISGVSGSGKSTIAKVISGFFAANPNTVFVNNAAIQTNNYYDAIGYVDNNSFLLADNLQNNITLADPNFDAQKYAAIVNLLELNHLEKLPVLDGDNQKVSAGEQQRINLARYLYKGYHFLILDEALSNLDPKLFQKIEAFLINQPNLTLIHITHHLNTANVQAYNHHLTITNHNLVSV